MIIADDFGLLKEANAEIGILLEERAVTAASLLVNGPAFEDAAKRIEAHAEWSIGFHFNLTEGRSVCPAREISSLVNRKGSFKYSIVQLCALTRLGLLPVAHISKEIDAQWSLFRSVCPSAHHISGHQHVHLLPGVIDCILSLAKRSEVFHVRYPFEERQLSLFRPIRSMRMGFLRCLCRRARPVFHEKGFETGKKFYGFYDAGNLSVETMVSLIRACGDDGVEIMCHPGNTDKPERRDGFTVRHYRESTDTDVCRCLRKKLRALPKKNEK